MRTVYGWRTDVSVQMIVVDDLPNRAKLLEHAGMDSVDLLENALVETNKWTLSFIIFKS